MVAEIWASVMSSFVDQLVANKAEEGASKGEKIFQITNAMKFHAKRKLLIKWLHTIGTGHNVDRLIFNWKMVCKDHFTEQYFKKDFETFIAGQFVYRHQATDAIAPRKSPESFAFKCFQIPPKTSLFRYSFRLIPYNIQALISNIKYFFRA